MGDEDELLTPPPPPNPEMLRRKIDYSCTNCGRPVGRENLKVKRIQYKGMGIGARVERTRTVAWLCVTPQDDGKPSCLEADEAWHTERFASSPGFQDTKLASP